MNKIDMSANQSLEVTQLAGASSAPQLKRSTMKILIIPIVCFVLLLEGCVAPGSGIGNIGFRAKILNQDDGPQGIAVFLSKHYGLGGLDRYFGEPEDYGREDREIVGELKEGEYKVDFGKVVYHVNFWLLPPLGPFPRQPPAPYYYLKFSDNPDEIYLVGLVKDGFDYKVYNNSTRKELDKSEATWSIKSCAYEAEDKDEDMPINYLTIEIELVEPVAGGDATR